MHYTFTLMTEPDAHAIAAWHYEAPYDFYDADRDPEDLAELLNPQSWQESYYSVHNEQGDLLGFFVFKHNDDDTLTIGLGLRPDLTGKGLGADFLQAGLSFAQERFFPALFRLDVAIFNKRAIHAYERAGFMPLKIYMNKTNGGEYEFLQMVRQA